MQLKQAFAICALAAAGQVAAQGYGAPAASAAATTAAVTTAAATASPAAPAATPAAGTGKTIKVMVGNNTLTFIPNNVKAAIGDTVVFEWPAENKANHSVVQSTRATICTKNTETTAFSSGPRPGGAAPFNVTITNTKPIWFYCGVPTHCQKGMYGVINPPADFVEFPKPNDPAAPGAGNATNGTATGDATPKTGAGNALVASTTIVLGAAAAVAAFLL
jgi:plastocyanin